MSPARCAAVDYDVPKAQAMVATLPPRTERALPVIVSESVTEWQAERTRDRLSLHRVLRI